MKNKKFSISMPTENWIGVQHEINHSFRDNDDYINNSMIIGLSHEIASKIGRLIVDETNGSKSIKFCDLSIERDTEQWVDLQEEINNLISERSDRFTDVENIMVLSNQIADEIAKLIISE